MSFQHRKTLLTLRVPLYHVLCNKTCYFIVPRVILLFLLFAFESEVRINSLPLTILIIFCIINILGLFVCKIDNLSFLYEQSAIGISCNGPNLIQTHCSLDSVFLWNFYGICENRTRWCFGKYFRVEDQKSFDNKDNEVLSHSFKILFSSTNFSTVN